MGACSLPKGSQKHVWVLIPTLSGPGGRRGWSQEHPWVLISTPSDPRGVLRAPMGACSLP